MWMYEYAGERLDGRERGLKVGVEKTLATA